MTRSPRFAPRRGYSLIEVLTVIGVMTVLLTLCAGMLKLLLNLDHAGRDALAVAADAERLGRAFRLDAHRATTPADRDADGRRVAWGLPDGERVEYAAGPDGIRREVRRDNRSPRRESFQLPPRAAARFDASDEAGRPFLTLTVHRPATHRQAAVDERVVAEVGRDRRLIARQP